MDVLPLILLALAVFVVVRLVQMALDPRARQNAVAPPVPTTGLTDGLGSGLPAGRPAGSAPRRPAGAR